MLEAKDKMPHLLISFDEQCFIFYKYKHIKVFVHIVVILSVF